MVLDLANDYTHKGDGLPLGMGQTMRDGAFSALSQRGTNRSQLSGGSLRNRAKTCV
jgi:hypothetical protein